MNKLIVLFILTILSVSGVALAEAPAQQTTASSSLSERNARTTYQRTDYRRVTRVTKPEQVAAAALFGAILRKTGLDEVAGVQHGGSLTVKTRVVVINERTGQVTYVIKEPGRNVLPLP